jgi:hypothetical protein
MRKIVKKILKEEFDWIEDALESPIIVTTENVYLNARVKLRRTSTFYNQAPDVVGTVMYNDPKNDDLFYATPDEIHEDYWVWVEFDNGYDNSYAVGPNEFDLEFVFE